MKVHYICRHTYLKFSDVICPSFKSYNEFPSQSEKIFTFPDLVMLKNVDSLQDYLIINLAGVK